MKRGLITLLILIFIASAGALGLSDFVPTFMSPKSIESSGENYNLPVHPLVDIKGNTSQTKSWYCHRSKEHISGNVFCDKNSNVVASDINYAGSTNSKSVTSTSLTTVNEVNPASVNTSSNQQTLQDTQLKDALDRQNYFTIPIQPSKDVKMNVNSQKVEFNIKY